MYKPKTGRKITLLAFLCLFSAGLSAQEALKSQEETYYDFLALRGLSRRPYLNFRTLSDSAWALDDNAAHPWQGQNLGVKRQLFNNVFLRVYGPELFASFNSAAPYGQNDGALWQGKGFNSSMTGGVRLEGYGAELTFKPQLALSQNVKFDLMPSQMRAPQYAGKADDYGYFWGTVDAPQRFGDKPVIVFDWGDSEIRYTWKTLTLGFGTQAIWLGPSYLNSMLHSNNAPSYPKVDLGLRRQAVTIPFINWYLGDIEARLWVGQLTESGFFDWDTSNDHTMFHGFSFAYAPSFLPGLTLFANRVALVAWEWENLQYLIPKEENTIEDQKASFGVSWIFPTVGLEVYGELGVDDFVPHGLAGYQRYPIHTMTYTVGLKKTIPIVPPKNIYGMIFFEWNSMEMSQDFQLQWPYTAYFHHYIIHGYTNRGQWIGAGSAWGGNSQYLEFKLYYPKGVSSLFVHRNNPDNNFIYSKAVYASAEDGQLESSYFTSWKANFIVGANTNYFLSNNFSIGGGLAYNLILNPLYYYNKTSGANVHQDNYSFNISMQLSL
ncbi:MAG: capsule assembly Wzi family protein [Treponema sp.]|nr:capsule assembly Wzi family protein [Treponema sp.]